MRRLYLRACKKTMLSLHLSEWLEWKCRSAAQSVGFLYRVVESLRSAPIWIFISRKDISWVECSKVNLIVWWRLFMKSFMDWSCLVVPMNIRKMSSVNLFQKGIAQTFPPLRLRHLTILPPFLPYHFAPLTHLSHIETPLHSHTFPIFLANHCSNFSGSPPSQ